MKYLEGLNERQREAALHGEGPLLIVAGAGAGKTKTITHRIAHLIEQGVPAHHLLAVTFTNKAAGEMRERVRALIPEGRGLPLVATFHSLGVRLLREFSADAGVPRGFVIWDRDDSQKALKKILDAQNDKLPPRAALSAISREKGKGTSAREFAGNASNFKERALAPLWEAYEKVLAEESALDFDDLLLRTLALLRNSPQVLDRLQNRWRYITIDEYQDTNGVQYEIARLLAGEQKNITVVADPDQSIYTWRQARIENVLEFEEMFPGAKVVTLEQNYRSTRTILKAANGVIEKNVRRKPKVLFTDNPTGEPLVVYGAVNEMDEAWFVAQSAVELMQQGTSAQEIAVLYRENFQSRALEEAMLHASVPYRVLGTRFFARKEVKDTLSYLRAALNPKSRVDLMRIVGVPARGIGKVTLEKMLVPLENRPAAGVAAAAWGGFSLTGVNGANRMKVEKFIATLEAIRKAIAMLPASEAVRFAVEASGMEKMYKKDSAGPSSALGASGKEKLDNIGELINFAARFDSETPPLGIERLLEEAALQSDQDQLEEKQQE